MNTYQHQWSQPGNWPPGNQLPPGAELDNLAAIVGQDAMNAAAWAQRDQGELGYQQWLEQVRAQAAYARMLQEQGLAGQVPGVLSAPPNRTQLHLQETYEYLAMVTWGNEFAWSKLCDTEADALEEAYANARLSPETDGVLSQVGIWSPRGYPYDGSVFLYECECGRVWFGGRDLNTASKCSGCGTNCLPFHSDYNTQTRLAVILRPARWVGPLRDSEAKISLNGMRGSWVRFRQITPAYKSELDPPAASSWIRRLGYWLAGYWYGPAEMDFRRRTAAARAAQEAYKRRQRGILPDS